MTHTKLITAFAVLALFVVLVLNWMEYRVSMHQCEMRYSYATCEDILK